MPHAEALLCKLIKETLTKVKSAGQKGEPSHSTTPGQLQEEVVMYRPQQKNHLYRKDLWNTRQEVHCISYKKSTTPATQPWETVSTWTFFLCKTGFLLFVGLAYGFCYSLLVPNSNSLLFPDKPIFASKITVLFLRSTQSINMTLKL